MAVGGLVATLDLKRRKERKRVEASLKGFCSDRVAAHIKTLSQSP